MATRFVRVEQALGLSAGLFDAEDADVWAAVDQAIGAEIPEAPDLDFKGDWWGKPLVEMAKDCATFANGLGGVIVVGSMTSTATWPPDGNQCN